MINISISEQSDKHQDLTFHIGGMIEPAVVDTYYFYLSLNDGDKPFFLEKFKFWLIKIVDLVKQINTNQELNIPICLYDEYSEFISIKKFNNKGMCNLYLKSVSIEGYTFNPWTDTNMSIQKDLIHAYKGGVICHIDEIIEGLEDSIRNI